MVTSPDVLRGRVYETRGPDRDPDPDVLPTCFFGGLSGPLNSTRAAFGRGASVAVSGAGCASRSAGVCRVDIVEFCSLGAHDHGNETDELKTGGGIWPKLSELATASK